MHPKLTHWSSWHIAAVGLALCVLLTVGVYFAGISPLVDRYEAYLHDRDLLMECRGRARELHGRQRSLRNQLAQARREIEGAALQLQPARTINRRMKRLTDLVEQMDLELDTQQPGKSVVGKWYERVFINLTVRGEFADCVRLVHKLLSDLPDMGVARLSLSRNPSVPDEPTLMQLELVWFTAPTVQTASASD